MVKQPLTYLPGFPVSYIKVQHYSSLMKLYGKDLTEAIFTYSEAPSRLLIGCTKKKNQEILSLVRDSKHLVP